MLRNLLRYASIVVFMAMVLAILALLLYTDFGRRLPPAFLSASASEPAPAPPPVPEQPVPEQPDVARVVDALPAADRQDVGGDLDAPPAPLDFLARESGETRDASVELINLRVQAGELDEALRLSQEILTREPGNLDVRLRLAALHAVLGRANDAYREASTVLVAQPDSSGANLLVADIAMRSGLPSLAVKHARAAAEKKEHSVEAARMLAQAYAAEGSVQEALRQLESLIAILPDDVDLLVQIGSLYGRTGDRAQAAVALNKAAEIAPENPTTLLALAQLDMTKGDFAASIARYRGVLEMAPNHVLALNNLAAILPDHGGDLDEAFTLAQKAWQLAPEAPNIADTLGWLFFLRRDYDRALAYLTTAVRRLPREPEVRYHYGAVLYARGMPREAEQHLAAALNMRGDFHGAEHARRLLEAIRDNKPFEP